MTANQLRFQELQANNRFRSEQLNLDTQRHHENVRHNKVSEVVGAVSAAGQVLGGAGKAASGFAKFF